MAAVALDLRSIRAPRWGGPASWAQLGLLAATAVWGLAFVVTQDALATVPVLSFLAARFLVAAAAVLPFAARDLRRTTRATVRDGVVLGAVLAAGFVAQTASLEHTTATNAGFITGLVVVLVPLIAAVVLRHRASRGTWLAALVATAGLALLAGGGSGLRPLGDGLALIGAVWFAVHVLLTDRAAARHPLKAVLLVQLATTGVLSLVAAAAFGQLALPTDPAALVAVAITALLGTAAGFLVQLEAQRHVAPARTALILAAEPAFAGLFGLTLAGDHLGPLGWLGAVVVLGAVAFAARPARPVPSPAERDPRRPRPGRPSHRHEERGEDARRRPAHGALRLAGRREGRRRRRAGRAAPRAQAPARVGARVP